MKKFITLIIAITMIATLATGCGVDTPAEDVFNKYDKDTTITETEKDSADKSDDKDDDKSDSDKKDESDKKDDNKSESDKKDDDKVADNKPADNADKNNGSKPSGSGSTNSNTGSKPSGGNSNSGSKPSGGNTNQSKPVEPQKPSHSHSYAVVSQTGATCTAAGVTTYKCSCGHSYTEQNGGALGHAWQTQYNEWDEVVHHPGTVVTKIGCTCGQVFDSENAWLIHNDDVVIAGGTRHSFSDFPEEVGGYDQTVHHKDPCGQKCTRCGANG